MRLGFDCDGVFYNWFDTTHAWMRQTGVIAADHRPEHDFTFYRNLGFDDYGRFFAEVVGPSILAGVLGRQGAPMPNASDALTRVRDEGHETFLITARGGIEPFVEAEIEATQWWLDEHGLAFDEVIYTQDKVAAALRLGLDAMVEDQLNHQGRLVEAGVETWLVTWPWNAELETPFRVEHLGQFADAVRDGRVGHTTRREVQYSDR